MIIMLTSFAIYILWNVFCYIEVCFKLYMYRKSSGLRGNELMSNICSTKGTKLLSTASLTIMTTAVGYAVALITCYTQPIVIASFVISIAALNSAASWVSTHGFTEHITLLPDAVAIGVSAYVVGKAGSKYSWERSNDPSPNLYLAMGAYVVAVVSSILFDITTCLERRISKRTVYVLTVNPEDTGSSSYLVIRERLFCANYKSNIFKVAIVLIVCMLCSFTLAAKIAVVAGKTGRYLDSNPLPRYNNVYKATPIVGSVAIALNALSSVVLLVEILLLRIDQNAMNVITQISP